MSKMTYEAFRALSTKERAEVVAEAVLEEMSEFGRRNSVYAKFLSRKVAEVNYSKPWKEREADEAALNRMVEAALKYLAEKDGSALKGAALSKRSYGSGRGAYEFESAAEVAKAKAEREEAERRKSEAEELVRKLGFEKSPDSSGRVTFSLDDLKALAAKLAA